MPDETKVDEWLKEFNERRDRSAKAAAERLNALCDRCALAGITTVRMEFSGEGDSGSVNEITTSPAVEISQQMELELGSCLYDIVPYDWVNDDGGSGVAVLRVFDRKLSVRTSIRHTEYTNYEDSYDLASAGKEAEWDEQDDKLTEV